MLTPEAQTRERFPRVAHSSYAARVLVATCTLGAGSSPACFIMKPIKEPTNEQCTNNELVYEDEVSYGYAMWHPQMGGYVGKCIAVMDKKWHSNGAAISGGCVDLYVWHNGEYPFSEKDGSPALVHYCDPEQGIRFWTKIRDLNDSHFDENDTSTWEPDTKKGPSP